jgi:hypothetical protein
MRHANPVEGDYLFGFQFNLNSAQKVASFRMQARKFCSAH